MTINSPKTTGDGSILSVLRHCSLFENLSDTDLRALQPACLRMRLKPDDYLFHAGSPGGASISSRGAKSSSKSPATTMMAMRRLSTLPVVAQVRS